MWPMLIGFQKAKELLFLGDNIPAAEAARLGLITRCVPDAELDAAIDALTARLAKLPPFALKGTKKAINHTLKGLALATFEYGVSLETQSQLTRDHAEAVDAFVDKRKPQYTGR
jgi:enoyl-CoA hydratase